MVILVTLSFSGWIICYFVQLTVLGQLAPGSRAVPDLLTALLSVIPAILLTNLLIRPVRRAFAALNPDETKHIVGRSGVIVTPYADENHGMAQVEDGGAGLLLQVRARPGERFLRGQRAALLEYRPEDNSYLIVPELEL
ncbi:hypothetical protein ACFP81_14300 [Deinococcus lacus]|uniref:DUF1449 domain-containing protein n=1 Tax=Deinococcus lacus TaxID=392561 RepID=A0ABW1YF12_9DEIO